MTLEHEQPTVNQLTHATVMPTSQPATTLGGPSISGHDGYHCKGAGQGGDLHTYVACVIRAVSLLPLVAYNMRLAQMVQDSVDTRG